VIELQANFEKIVARRQQGGKPAEGYFTGIGSQRMPYVN
jgi:hypothetical protein